MKARGGLAFLVCALAALALPATVAAKPGYYVVEPGIFNTIDLRGSHGYSIHVFGVGRNQVWILAEKEDASANYLGRGRVTERSIEGRFGSLGRISVRLQPGSHSEVEEEQAGCKGKPAERREGRFTGVIRFRGELGFTEVRVESARGTAYRSFRQVCKRRSSEGEPRYKQPPATSLSAVSSRYPRAPWFSVFKQEPPRKPAFAFLEAQYTTRTIERRPGLDVIREASATAAPETFAASPLGANPVTATVAPPAPFTGTASYEKQPSGVAAWSGDLAVELPGLGVVPLADSSYHAELCHSLACACPIGECFFVSVRVVQARAQRLRRLAARVRP